MDKLILPPLHRLETERLILRPMSEVDARVIVGWRNSEHIATMSIQASNGNLTVEGQLHWFRNSRSSRVDYVIETKDDAQPIGSVSLTWRQMPACVRCGEIGKYIGDPAAFGKGFASEAVARWRGGLTMPLRRIL